MNQAKPNLSSTSIDGVARPTNRATSDYFDGLFDEPFEELPLHLTPFPAPPPVRPPITEWEDPIWMQNGYMHGDGPF